MKTPKQNRKSRLWKKGEDKKLIDFKNKNPNHPWKGIAMRAGLEHKADKSCWERWKNQLNPDISKQKFSLKEDELIRFGYEFFGNKWAFIRDLLPERTANDIKNRYNHHLNRKRHKNAHGTHLFHPNQNIPDASSSSILTPVSAPQEITNQRTTSEDNLPEFPGERLLSAAETIHSFGGYKLEYLKRKHATSTDQNTPGKHLFHPNQNIPDASSSSILTSVIASQEIANLRPTSKAYPPKFPEECLLSDNGTIHSFGGNERLYLKRKHATSTHLNTPSLYLFHPNHNIPDENSSSIFTSIPPLQDITIHRTTSEDYQPEFPRECLLSYAETIHSFGRDKLEHLKRKHATSTHQNTTGAHLFHPNQNIPETSSSSILTSISASQEITNLRSTSEDHLPELPEECLLSYAEIIHSFGGYGLEYLKKMQATSTHQTTPGTHLFHPNHNISDESSSSIHSSVSASQEITNLRTTSEDNLPEFPGTCLLTDPPTIHSFGEYEFEYLKRENPTSTHQNTPDTHLFNPNQNIQDESSSTILTSISASQEITNLRSPSEAYLAEFHWGCLFSDGETIDSSGGDELFEEHHFANWNSELL